MVSILTFKSLIQFWVFFFFFVCGVRKCSNFILLHAAVQFPQHHLLKILSFSHCIFLLPFHRLIDHTCMGLFLGSLICSTDPCVHFCASTIGCVVLSCVQLFETSWIVAHQASLWDFPGKSTGVHCHFLLHEIFLLQGLNPYLLHWQLDCLPLSHHGSPYCFAYCSFEYSLKSGSVIPPSLFFFLKIGLSIFYGCIEI